MSASFDKLFCPKGVAVIGASDNPNKVGGRPIHYLKKYGYTGNIYPINPTRPEIQGLRAYSNIEDVPTIPEAVVIAVAGGAAIEQVQRCGRAGVKFAVVMSSGFSELGSEGQKREAELVTAANESGIRVIGPNAQGVANFATGAVLNFSTMFMDVEPMDGPIAIVSQSGAASVIPYALLRQQGFGVRYVIATGNDSDAGACAMAEAVAEDPDIRLILVYLESISDPDRLVAASKLARARGAYIVAIKSGSSERGAVAAASHTGAIAGNDAAVDAFFFRHGIWRARDINEFIRATPLYLDNLDTKNGQIVAMSHSGAVAVMTADLAEHVGLELTSLSEETKQRLAGILPDFGTPNNPLDMTAAILSESTMFQKVLNAIGTDAGADAMIVSVPVAGPGYDIEAFAEEARSFSQKHEKPLIVCAPQASVRQAFSKQRLPTFVTDSDAIRAMAQYISHQRLIRKAGEHIEPPEPLRLEGSGLLDEASSLSILSMHGVPVVKHRLCSNPEEAVAAFRELGDFVAVKGCAANIPHKSEHGLVCLAIRSADGVADATRSCLMKLAEMHVASPKVVVAQMVRGIHEFALGVSVDDALGPVVMIGEGGTLLELRRDVATLLAPFSLDDAKRAIRSLRVGKLFDGYRGEDALDLDAFARAAVALGNFAAASGKALKSVDVNPVMVMAGNDGIVAVDAVIELR
jgi:acyl-CoA synthetase (NDP forming)